MAPVKDEIVLESDVTRSNTITPTLPEMIPLGEYLFLRISQANPKLKSIFGIPGDFNLTLLDCLYSELIASKDIKFVGICNELNAAYTADGYSRIMQALTVLVTTFGVGELSAINGVAGSFSEYSPILHLVGTTSMKQRGNASEGIYSDRIENHHHLVQSKNPLEHPNHDIYKQMSAPVSVIQESLDDNTCENLNKIDKVLITVIKESRPGYLFIPCDVPDIMVPTQRLYGTPLKLFDEITPKSREILDEIVGNILNKLYNSSTPSIFGDCLVSRFGLESEFNELIEKLPQNLVKLFSSNLGRYINEDLPNYIGLYFAGGSSNKVVKEEFENHTDCLINFGFFNSETTTGGYQWNISNIKDYIEIHPDYVKINNKVTMLKDMSSGSRKFTMRDLLIEMKNQLDISKFVNIHRDNIKDKKFYPTIHCTNEEALDHIPQTRLIDHLNENLQYNDILVMDTMSFSFALPDIKFPAGLKLVTQNFYGSIGYALPSSFGVTMAVNDLGWYDRRIILVEGDGAAQMTVQELSGYVRHSKYIKNFPKIFLINNDGYTIERMINGPTKSYNDICSNWDWANILKVFGDPYGKYHKSYKISNLSEFNHFFKKGADYGSRFDNSKLEFFELIMGKFDAPPVFKELFVHK
ncbi:pyruvate decarboxylase [Scheffersomyces amazonensis]|uniref:pyruvate decarboxylase n=1 Tax=Scheffersomyces amazonensis TaxID=1078765 RepID=UPI00315C69A2